MSEARIDAALSHLRKALADPTAEFREGQWEAIDALVNRRKRMLVVQRTGWGKSSVYFIATRLLRDQGAGPTLIVSPLLALMRNQLEAALRLGIEARRIDSTNRKEWSAHQTAIAAGEIDALLVSPERLANEQFIAEVLLPIADRVGMLVVDEAHCISDWGHDFRPDYRRIIGILRNMPPNMPVLGTTATANDRVVQDVVAQLGRIEVQRGSLMRATLCLEAIRLPDQAARLAWLAQHVPSLPGTGIVYALTKRDTEQVADWLKRNGIDARAYHSDVRSPDFESTDAYRKHLEELLLSNRIKVLVATTALGMGYDKPDLGFVVHYQAPGSIVAYYQQVGRAGRAISRAVGVLLSGREDEDIHEFFREKAFPSEDDVEAILSALERSDGGLTQAEIESVLNLRHGLIRDALKFLSVEDPSPVVKDGSTWLRTAVAYRMDHTRIQRLTSLREREWEELQAYVDTRDCRMQFLARALDDPHAERCGRCSNCAPAVAVGERFEHQLAVSAALVLRHSEMPLKCSVRVPNGALPICGLSGNLSAELRAQEGRILSRWGDAGWGRVVRDGKHAGHFSDELVEAVVEMLGRWQPEPAPTWVTCIPSRRHPELVPDFTRRVAARLRLPFESAVAKFRDNDPQKEQQNSWHQCHNLDGAFTVSEVRPGGPVLLVDDMVDSSWTLAIVSALLLRAGSGPVWPIALASTSTAD